jgi:predicted amidophosphoribosyltransferase
MRMQSIIKAIYPAQCVACDTFVEGEDALCPACWKETQFISGTICDLCGTPLPGDAHGQVLHCDDCLKIARPWHQGRAALVYAGVGRRMVLALKHGDRTDLARIAAGWMARQAVPLVWPDTLLVPVPLNRWRLLRRRYNQAALLAQALGRRLDRPVCVDALRRPGRTAPLQGHDRAARFAALAGQIQLDPARAGLIKGRSVMIVDDVMTSGATLAACADALALAGAAHLTTLTLARVVKDA